MSRSQASGGFTLIEALVALASVSVLVAGAAGLLSIASLAVRSAGQNTTAMLLAIQKVEQLGASPVALASGTAQDYFAADGTPSLAASATFTRRWIITSAWASSERVSVVVEVSSPRAGRIAEVQAIVGGGGGSWP